ITWLQRDRKRGADVAENLGFYALRSKNFGLGNTCAAPRVEHASLCSRGNGSWRRARTGRAFSKSARYPARSRSIPRPRRPSAPASAEAVALIRDAMAAGNVAAVARTVVFRRVRSVLIRAHGEGLIAHTLNFDYRGALRQGGLQRTTGRECGRRDARPGTPH